MISSRGVRPAGKEGKGELFGAEDPTGRGALASPKTPDSGGVVACSDNRLGCFYAVIVDSVQPILR